MTAATIGRRVRVLGDLFHGRIPAGAVYVGRAAPGLRASRYANPHRVGRACRRCPAHHDPADAVRAYARYLAGRPPLDWLSADDCTGGKGKL